MKKFLAIVLVLGILFTAAACNSKDEKTTTTTTPNTAADTSTDNGGTGAANPPAGETAKPDEPAEPSEPGRDVLNIALTQDRGTLDAVYMLGYDLMNAMRMVYEPLWDFNKNGEYVWYLATSVDLVEPTVWHIHVRENVKFANGNVFNAEDVMFSMERANNRTGEPATFPYLNLEKSSIIDDYTVELVFDAYDMAYPYSFAYVYMYDKEYCEGDIQAEILATTPNGTGPYVVSDYVINSHLDLTARDDYWGTKPSIPKHHYTILTEDSQRVTALQAGTVDIAGVPYQDIAFVQTLDNMIVDIASASSGGTTALYFNPGVDSAFYNNPDARKAVALALDREAIADIAYSGYATVSRLPVSAFAADAEERFFDIGVYGIGQDIDLAKQLAESSGLAGKTITLIDNGSSDRVVIAELIQADLQKIGVTVKINNLDPGSWLSYVFDEHSGFDFAIDMTGAPSNTLAQNYYSWIFYHIGGAFAAENNPWPNKERGLELASTIMGISDPAQLSEVYMELTQIQIEALLWFNLVDLQRAVAYNSGIKNYTTMLGGHTLYCDLSW